MKFLKEPLLHFVLAGGLLFALYGWLNPGADENTARTVSITQAEVEWLKETWARQWNRQPTDEELGGVLADYLKEEILSREARELGLQDNDLIVRRRLAQKMSFLVEDTARAVVPSDEELELFYNKTKDNYLFPAVISFDHAYFSRDKRGDHAESDAHLALKELLLSETLHRSENLGDPALFSLNIIEATQSDVSGQFGQKFTDSVFGAEESKWLGPIESDFGFHLVYVRKKKILEQKTLDEARDQVLRDWEQARKERVDKEYYSKLLKKYDVSVDEKFRPLLGSLLSSSKKSQ